MTPMPLTSLSVVELVERLTPEVLVKLHPVFQQLARSARQTPVSQDLPLLSASPPLPPSMAPLPSDPIPSLPPPEPMRPPGLLSPTEDSLPPWVIWGDRKPPTNL